MTGPPEPGERRPPAPASPETNAIVLATAMVGVIALVATWLLWHARPPLPLESGALWTTVLLMGLPLVGAYALTDAEVYVFGWRRGDPERSARYALGLVVLALPFIVASIFVTGSVAAWPHDSALPDGTYGAFGVALALAWRAFVLEWFFRGFLLFGLFHRLGAFAILAQTAAFGLLYIGAPWPLAVAAWPAGFLLGFVAWRCGSFLPAAAAHIAIALLLLLARTLAGPVG